MFPHVAYFIHFFTKIISTLKNLKFSLKTIALCKTFFWPTPTAFNERVTFSLQHAWSLPGAHALNLLHSMFVLLRIDYTRANTQIMQHTHTHMAVTGHIETKKLLSHRRQSEYRKRNLPRKELHH